MFKIQDFEKLWYHYKSEGEPNGLSIERYCMMNVVPYRQFEKWFRSTCQKIVPIQVDGASEQETRFWTEIFNYRHDGRSAGAGLS